jgi:hypothetical protein
LNASFRTIPFKLVSSDIGRKAVIRHAIKPSAELIVTIGHWSFNVRAINLSQYHMLIAGLLYQCDANGLDPMVWVFVRAT